jgi:hypothetical protein
MNVVIFLKKIKINNMKIFLQSFFQVGLVAINTMLIAKGYILGVFLVSFLISLLWAFNVSKVAISTLNQKLTYALGAGCGAVSGLLIIKIFI